MKKPTAAQKKVEKVMHEYKQHTLKSSSGQKVTSRKQAIAIMLSEKRNEEETGSADRPQRSRPVRRKRG